MLVELGWYRNIEEMMINGHLMKKNSHVIVPEISINLDPKLSYIVVRLYTGCECRYSVDVFMKKFAKTYEE